MGEETFETIKLTRDAGVVRLTLNRPEKKNAINATMWSELERVFDEVSRRRADRVLVVGGAGGAFCSGADLSGTSNPDGQVSFGMDRIQGVALALHRLPIPVIARVDGDAVGAGCNLALGCDIILATTRSRFAEIFVRRGLSVDFGGSWLLPRLIGLHRAKLLCLTGDLISAQEAAELGLVNQLVEVEDLDSAVESLVERLLAASPMALAHVKRLLNDGIMSTMAEALDAEAVAQAVNSSSEDAKEARAAFAAKRPPVFTGN